MNAKDEFREWYNSDSGLLSEWIDFPEDEFTLQQYEYKSEFKHDFLEYFEQRIYECNIIGYMQAMDFLTQHDKSLNDSIEIASDLGYNIKQINSELLATLLLQENLKADLRNMFS